MISHYIAVKENVQRYCFNNIKGQQFSLSKKVSEVYGDPTEVLTASSSGDTRGSSKPSLPCIFCRGDHFNEMCHQYPNL